MLVIIILILMMLFLLDPDLTVYGAFYLGLFLLYIGIIVGICVGIFYLAVIFLS